MRILAKIKNKSKLPKEDNNFSDNFEKDSVKNNKITSYEDKQVLDYHNDNKSEKARESYIKRLLIFVLGSLFLFLVIFIFNQSYIFANFISFGNKYIFYSVLLILFFLLIFILFLPILIFFRYKNEEVHLDKNNAEQYEIELLKLLRYLKRNKCLIQKNFLWDDNEIVEVQISEAYKVLSIEANKIIKKEANSVFFSTAVSQNGLLDALFVLCSLIRLIYKIGKLYQNRPNLLNLLKLYSNIAMTLLLTKSINDLSLIEDQVEAIVSTVLGSTVLAMIPGTTLLANLMMTSIIEGSLNAFLTLRVGVMTKKILSSCYPLSKESLRKSTTIESSGMLFALMKENVASVIKLFSKKITNYPRRLWQK